MIPCIACSEATVERLFSFLHRTVGHFLRKSLKLETMEMMTNIYINTILKQQPPFERDETKYLESHFEEDDIEMTENIIIDE